MGFLTSLFSGGLVGSIERVASEWIETDMESAQAQTLMLKTLDPNGKMRRDLSRFACVAYGFYLLAMVSLSFMVAFRLSNLFRRLLGESSMQPTFSPYFETLKIVIS